MANFMHNRESILGHILQNSAGKVTRWRSWEDAGKAEKAGVLRLRRPSGYSEWFVITEKAIWWVYMDSSDGGSWGSLGIEINGYSIPYDIEVVKAIYSIPHPNGYDKK